MHADTGALDDLCCRLPAAPTVLLQISWRVTSSAMSTALSIQLSSI